MVVNFAERIVDDLAVGFRVLLSFDGGAGCILKMDRGFVDANVR